MDGMRRDGRCHRVLVIAVAVMAVVLGGIAGEAFASAACTAGGGVQTAGLCTISAPVTACPYALTLPAGESLLITSTGSIRCNGTNANGQAISITVTDGDMEMQSGSEISADSTGSNTTGGAITIAVPKGDLTMRGTGAPAPAAALSCAAVAGACISSSNLSGTGFGGTVTITAGNFPNTPPEGKVTMEPGSAVLVNSAVGSAGAIDIRAGLTMDIDGLVRSFGGMTGTTGGNQRPGGGPIGLRAGCQLQVTPAGVVSSEGRDPGADLVHLEGCEVTINGLVQSIGLGNAGGHAIATSPPNHCNADTVTHPATFSYTACVEVWGNNVTINGILPNKGQVNADGIGSGGAVLPTRAWIDVYAKQNITLNNDNVGPYAVHANSGATEGDFGGLITIKAEQGKFVATGATGTSPSFAVQANGLNQSGHGGDVTIQAGANVELNASTVQAKGGNTGTNRTGGTIAGRSFNGSLLGNAPGVLDANAAAPVIGAITLTGCVAVNYTGTTLPPAVIATGVCGGNPVLPITFLNALAALAPVCESPDCAGGQCAKQGRKFDAKTNAGLSGWQICAFNSLTGTQVDCQTTGANGTYTFNIKDAALCETSLTFCEVLQAGFTQMFPTLPSVDPTIVSCSGLVGPGPLGPVGYKETIGLNNTSVGNDFGNSGTVIPGCPENPSAVCTVNVGAGGVPTVQQAYNNASNGDVICVFGNTIENVILGGAKSLTITQCTVGRVTAANNQLPVWTLSSTGKLTVIGTDAKNGTVGWLIAGGGGHDVRGVRASSASQIGIDITSNNNQVSFNSVSGSPLGVRIGGTGNDVRGGTVSGITGNGVLLTGNNNNFRTATVRQNSGAGIVVNGTGNTLDANRVNGNTGIGIHVNATATGTNLKSNLSGGPENGGAEYQLDTSANDLGSNRADGILIPSAQKCPTFAAAGTCE